MRTVQEIMAENGSLANIERFQTMQKWEYKRKVDLANLIEATCDILVKAGVLADDNSHIVAAHDGSRVDYDKKNPRVEIWIEEMEG